MSSIFLSYRRDDSVAASRGIYRYFLKCFGRDAVFMDIPEIRWGVEWEKKIDEKLQSSRIIMPVVGRHWLRLTDSFGMRRIDKPDDWVRREIVHGLTSGKIVLPVLLEGAE